jgi:aminopeptidase N
MFQNAFTDATWSKGLFYFLRARQYNYYNAEHLYQGLQRALSEDFPFNTPNVATIMRTWEFQAGFPLISVTRFENEISFRQERFFYGNEVSASLWWVPINYVTASSPNSSVTTPDFWFSTRDLRIQRESAPKPWSANDWIVVNIQQNGYFRVNYDNSLWNTITRQLNAPGSAFEAIHYLNRAQLIDDSFHLARAGRIGFDVMMGIMNYLERETDHVPWAMTNRANTLLNRWLTGSVVYADYQRFVRKNVQRVYDKLGVRIVKDELRVDRFTRAIAISLACQAGSTKCLTETTQELQNMFRTGTPVAPDLEAAIYCGGVRRANLMTLAFMQYHLLTSNRQFQRNTIITGLGCIENKQILRSHLMFALEQFELTNSERASILVSPVNNGETSLRVMMTFIQENFERINLINPNQVSNLCANIAARVSSEPIFEEFNDFLVYLQISGVISGNQANNFRSSARVILQWQERNLNDFIRFFGR